jgi:hypothetical protein
MAVKPLTGSSYVSPVEYFKRNKKTLFLKEGILMRLAEFVRPDSAVGENQIPQNKMATTPIKRED